MDYAKRFKVKPGESVKLGNIDPAFKDGQNRKSAEKEVEKARTKLKDLQELLYADGRHSMLICLQGMDTSGKDGVIKHLLAALNPQGCRVVGFKQPSREEAAHDFLWRVHNASPKRGEVVIFNRSQYEDVLVVRVHNLVPKEVWGERYDQINAFEAGLRANNTHVLKFFLHISKDEQLDRFKDRLDDPAKHWKISDADYKERLFWDDYTAAYEDALSRCSTERSPWYIIPSDHKWFRNLAIARIVIERLESMDMKFPAPSVDIDKIRKHYHDAKKRQ